MKYKSLSILHLCTIIWGIYFLLLCNSLLAQTYGTQTVSSTDPDPKELFHFQTPGGTTGTDKVIIAKFVVDDMTSDLEFRLEPTNIDKYHITDFKISQANVALNDGDTGDPVATLRVRDLSATEHAAAGFRIIKISVRYANNYVFTASEVWKIKAKQPTIAGTTLHYWGFWAEGTGETTVEQLVTRPKLINYIGDSQLTNFSLFTDFTSSTNISFGDVHINLKEEYLPDEQYQFRNVGTKALTITGANPISMPPSAYEIENYPSPPLLVLPMNAFSRRVTCKPTSLGPIQNQFISLMTDSTDVGNLAINLEDSTGIRLNSAILFDISGSMLEDKNGDFPVPPEQQKIRLARMAALELTELYMAILPDAHLGLYSYPSTNGMCPSSQELVAPNEIKHNYESFKNRLDAGLNHPDLINPPDAATPMAEGIGIVYNELSKGQPNQRNAVFQFGDGQHNCDSAGTKKTPADWYNDPAFQNSGIPFFTIPYGAYGAGWLQTFNTLADKTGGDSFPADIAADDSELQGKFKKALGKALELETLKDPGGQIASGASASHEVCVTASSYQLVFTVHWTVRNNNAIEVKLETPDHQFITPLTASASPDQVSYVSGETFTGYVVRGNYLRGGNGSGQWRLHIKGNVATPYVYQIYSKDQMKTQANFNLDYIYQTADLVIKINDGLRLVQDANVTAVYSMPTASINNYLASTVIDPQLIFKAPETIGNHPASLAERKLYALTHFTEKPFPGERRTGELKLVEEKTEPSKQGRFILPSMSYAYAQVPVEKARIFKTAFRDAKYDGLYDIKVRITGLTARSECFEREYSITRWADVYLSRPLIISATTWKDVQISPFFDHKLAEVLKMSPPDGYLRKSVVFTPKDEAGNYFGIGRASEISFAVKNAEPLGSIVDNLDGSYIQVVQYKKGANPSVTVTARDVTSPDIQMSEEIPFEFPVSIWILLSVIIFLVVIVIVLIVIFRK